MELVCFTTETQATETAQESTEENATATDEVPVSDEVNNLQDIIIIEWQ